LVNVVGNLLVKNYFREMFSFDFSNNADYTNGKISFMDAATPIFIDHFLGSALLLSLLSFIKKYSLIPLMGLITCMYLLRE
jgi:hypothetical protein